MEEIKKTEEMGKYDLKGATFTSSVVGDYATVNNYATGYDKAEKEILDIINNAKLTHEERNELISCLDSVKKGTKDTKNNKLVEFLKGLGINLASGIIANYLISKGFIL